jgi:predicted metal-dependent phosphoesterase TrpH
MVALAAREELRAVAVTDHDTTAGNHAALAAAVEFGIEVIPGVEISADSPYGTLHIVGLFIRPDDGPMEIALSELRTFRDERNRKMIRLLETMGIIVTMEELLKEAGGDLVGRPHFASLLVKKGVVKTFQEAFDVYLKSGGKAFLDKKRLPSDQAIAMIKAAGGLPILAHPFLMRNKDVAGFEANLTTLVEQGLRGLEVFYTDHSRVEEAYFSDVARRCNLLVSGGSDFHGAIKPDVKLGRGFGNLNISDEILENLKEALW